MELYIVVHAVFVFMLRQQDELWCLQELHAGLLSLAQSYFFKPGTCITQIASHVQNFRILFFEI